MAKPRLYLKKPVDLDELLLAVEKSNSHRRIASSARLFARTRQPCRRRRAAVGESAPIRNLREQISHLARIAPAESQPNVAQPTVLITGETGAGKDVAARLLHLSSANRAQPFVQVDCASLPRELIEAELFGHEKGAFTGSHGARPGLIEAAENGALFLDEVGELPLELQVKLLNVLERRKSRRLGSVKEYTIGARIMAATNRDLPQMIAQGSFRADLYYRLNVITLTVPPLRARHFAEQTGRRYGLPPVVLAADALPALCAYHWPGNVRELKHVIDRAALLGGGRAISASDLGLSPQPTASHAQNEALASSVLLHGLTLDGAERLLIERALRDCNENVSEAARRLGVSRMTLRYRMEKYSLKGS